MSPTLVPSYFVLLLAVANLVEGFGTVVLLTDSANMHSSSYKKQSAGIYWLRISPSVTGIPRGRTSGSSRLSLLVSNPPLIVPPSGVTDDRETGKLPQSYQRQASSTNRNAEYPRCDPDPAFPRTEAPNSEPMECGGGKDGCHERSACGYHWSRKTS